MIKFVSSNWFAAKSVEQMHVEQSQFEQFTPTHYNDILLVDKLRFVTKAYYVTTGKFLMFTRDLYFRVATFFFCNSILARLVWRKSRIIFWQSIDFQKRDLIKFDLSNIEIEEKKYFESLICKMFSKSLYMLLFLFLTTFLCIIIHDEHFRTISSKDSVTVSKVFKIF